jgi:hypothetical protein
LGTCSRLPAGSSVTALGDAIAVVGFVPRNAEVDAVPSRAQADWVVT